MNPSDYTEAELHDHAIEMQRDSGYILKDARPIVGALECHVRSTLGEFIVSLPAWEVREGDTIASLVREGVRVRRVRG
jgi:hypothetical protein